MPGWSKKDERMYEHIKDSTEQRGTPEDRAKEIAARTVNKHRREEGRTPSRQTQGTGNPNQPLSQHTKKELENQAREKGMHGYSRMRKAELIKALRASD